MHVESYYAPSTVLSSRVNTADKRETLSLCCATHEGPVAFVWPLIFLATELIL